MYVTKKLSTLRAAPHLMSLPPPDGPYSGILVIQDVDAIDPKYQDWFGTTGPLPLESLPIPQDTIIGIGESKVLTSFRLSLGISGSLMMIPVIDEPLSSNTYYVIQASSELAGLALTCWSDDEEDMLALSGRQGAKKQPFDPDNVNQQFKIIHRPGGASSEMYAESLSIDARPPSFMRKHKWVTASPMGWSCKLNEAEGQGICERLRNALPEFGFSTEVNVSDRVVVGRWYVPFIFVKEFGMYYKDQMRSSMYYKMSLEQRWEKIYETENLGGRSISVMVDINVKSDEVMLGGTVSVQGRLENGVVRYETVDNRGRGIGLSIGVVERMKWEQKRAGWVDAGGREVSVNERCFHNESGWRRFGCYVLVERFVLKRMGDGSLALAHDFYHIHQLRTKWE